MSYPTFALLLFCGLCLSLLLAVIKLCRVGRFSWFAVPWPFFLGWVLATCDHVWSTFAWQALHLELIPWSNLSLLLFVLVLVICVARVVRRPTR